MKIFIHDQKHGRVIGEPTGPTLREFERFVEFLNENVTNRYNRLVVAENYQTKYDEEEVVFY